MKRIFTFLLAFAFLISIVACSEEAITESSVTEIATSSQPSDSASIESSVESTDESLNETSEDEEMSFDKTKTYNILFIGNSYTYYSDMPEKIFDPIAKSANIDFKVSSLTRGGWYLIDTANPEDELGKLVDAALKNNKYDYVVLQEQSTCPAQFPGKFYDGVRKLVEKIRENGATPILYSTWGRKTGSATLPNLGWTHESMTWKIGAAYEAIADELDIEVAHVGFAFHDVYTNNPNLTDIYADDLTHPSYSGSYLAALTIFTKITGIDPSEVTYNGNLSGNITSVLKEAARKAVFETPKVPDEYKTKSEGINLG